MRDHAFSTGSLIAVGLGLLVGTACGPKQPTSPPVTAQTEVEQAPAPAPEPEPEPPKVPEDAIAVGTFNAQWAFDHHGDDRPRLARPYVPTTAEDWEWKRSRIVEILVAEKLDIVALAEVGGEREVGDIAFYIEEAGGPDYDWAFLPGTDRQTGQQVAILSRFPISNVRRFDVKIDKQVAADIELPNGTSATFVAMHMLDGAAPAYAVKRRKAARALRRLIAKEPLPVVMLGTLNSTVTRYDDGYDESLAGILAAKNNKSDDDDCFDSADEAPLTTVRDESFDRIITCGLRLRMAEVSGRELITRQEIDPDTPWPALPIEADPHRDVSDHYVVWAEVALPEPEAAPEPAGSTDTATP